MAKSTKTKTVLKASVKKPDAKKKALLTKVSSKKHAAKIQTNLGAIHLVIDININCLENRKAGISHTITTEAPNFSYSFNVTAPATIDVLNIEGQIKSPPGSSGSLYQEVVDPNNTIRIEVVGTSPAGSQPATMSLSYEGKPVFQDKALPVSGGNINYRERVKLPN